MHIQHIQRSNKESISQQSSRNVMTSATNESSIEPDLNVPEFRPTKEEFDDFKTYVEQLQKMCGFVGLCKVAHIFLEK